MGAAPGVRGRITLLAGQAFALGLTVAWTTVPASAIFLEKYGSGLLPVTYIGAAAAGTISTFGLGRATAKRALAHVAVRVFTLVTAVFVGAWVLLDRFQAGWVAFALLIVLPIAVPVGFMFIVGQAGMLLDVRTMKALYPRVIAGFALGFTLGGLAGPPILSAVGATEHLLLAAAFASLALVLLVSATRRRYATELSGVDDAANDNAGGDGSAGGHINLRDLLKNRFVVLIMAFQMLSAVESQWLDYLVYDRAGRRYTDGQELATFISRFLAIAYATDIVILLLVAGVLLRRYGLRLGLTANPAVVLALVTAVIVGGVAQGAGATIVFVLIVAARVSDLVLSDGTTRTSVSAAYQAIPKAERLAAQAAVESLGVPIAIGFSGVGLIVLNATVGTNGLVLPVLTSIVLAAWIVVALSMYRGYRANLLLNLRRRLLDPEELSHDGPNAMVAVERLLQSDDPRDVRLGLVSLSSIAPDDLGDRLQTIAMADRPVAFDATMNTLVRVDPRRAESVARRRLQEPLPNVRSTSFRVLAEVGDQSDSEAITEGLRDENDDVVAAAGAAAAHVGSIGVQQEVNRRVAELATAPDAGQRILAARLLGEASSSPLVDRSALAALINDVDVDVRLAALDAIDWNNDQQLAVDVVACLEDAATSATALASLTRSGPVCLDLADRALRGDLEVQRPALLQFVRACRAVDDPAAVDILFRHAHHHDRDVGLAVIRALAGRSTGDQHTRNAALARELLHADAEHATRVLAARRAVVGDGPAEILRSALTDELALLRQRVLAELALTYGEREIERVQLQLEQPSTTDQALALEWLEVTLTNDDRLALPLVEPGLSDDEQWRRLSRIFPMPTRSSAETVQELLYDPTDIWRRPWLAACTLLVAAEMDDLVVDVHAEPAHPRDHDNIVSETISALRHKRGKRTPP